MGLDFDSDPDFERIPVVDSRDWNLNLILCSVKSSTYDNLAIWFAV